MTHPEIASGETSGGTTTSHTIVVAALQKLLEEVGTRADRTDYEKAVVERNVLGKDTSGAKSRTFRYLRELYILERESTLFRALGDLWNDDAAGQPLLAGLCALARDPGFRASAGALRNVNPGDEMTSSDFSDAVELEFPDVYNASTIGKIGRNTASSWEQTGHLISDGRTRKVRGRAHCTASTLSFALYIGHLQGVKGPALFETIWVQVLDRTRSHLLDLAAVASRRSLIDFRHTGNVIEVGFSELSRPMEGRLL